MDTTDPIEDVADVRALLMAWDAIGVADEDGCQDEYDCMIGPLLWHLREGAGAAFLRDWIVRERTNHFGLSPDAGADRRLADALVAWRDDTAT